MKITRITASFIRGFKVGLLNRRDHVLEFVGSSEYRRISTTIKFFHFMQMAMLPYAISIISWFIFSYFIDTTKFLIWPLTFVLMSFFAIPLLVGMLYNDLRRQRFKLSRWRLIKRIYVVFNYLCVSLTISLVLSYSTNDAIYVVIVTWVTVFSLISISFCDERIPFIAITILHPFTVIASIYVFSWPHQREFYIENWPILLAILSTSSLVSFVISTGLNRIASATNAGKDRLANALTQLKQEKEYSEHIQDMMLAGILVVDEEGHITRSNTSFNSSFGSIRNLSELTALAQPDFPFDTEIIGSSAFHHKDGREFIVQSKKLVLKNGHDGRIVTFIDVTESRVAERMAIQTQKINEIGSMASRIAHDFNNHLAIIQANAELMGLGDIDSAEATGYSNAIIESCESAMGLTRHLLSYARSTHDDMHLTDVSKTFSRVTNLLSSALGPNFDLETVCDKDCYILVDQLMLESAILNLVMNSSAAMPMGGKIKVEAKIKGDKVVISVIDEGEGIPHDLISEVEKPFFTTKLHESGTGLGLATVAQFAKRHGSKLDIQSEVGKGTTVSLKFQLRMPEEDAHKIDKPEIQSNTTVSHKLNILVVDDNLILLKTLKEQLKALNHNVTTAHELSEIPSDPEFFNNIDAVLCDVVLRRQSGVDIVKHFRDRGLSTPFLFMSGNMPENLRQQLIDLGEKTFLQKPFSLSELGSWIEKLTLSD